MVIFVKPKPLDLITVKRVLQVFGEASGLKVNYRKSLATFIRGEEQDEELVQQILQCPLTEFPIKYLGLLLALRPLTKAEWQPMLDKVIDFIPAWQRGMIAREGRLTLVKTVIAAKPVHHLLVADTPVWLLEEVEKWMC